MKTPLIALVLGSTMSALAYAGGAATPATDAAAAPAAKVSQPNKMKQCNADAKGKHGTERRDFMSKCLSKKASN